MTKLPVVSGQQCIRALERAGFKVMRRKGSHVKLYRDNPQADVTVPDHDELDKGTLRAIIRQAGMTVDGFIALLS
jgi:predicted RNA binding protein YcfA (HicA-like mRNA interferase family)